MSFLSRIFDRSNSNKSSQVKLVVLGSSGAGKTTLIRYLEKGKPVEENVRTTLGIDYRTNPIKMNNWEFSLIDIGGQTIYQNTFWSLGISQADAIVYLFDGTIAIGSSKFNENLGQFKYMLDIIETSIPLLVLINKQDLPNCVAAEDFVEASEINKLINRSMTFLQTSAKYGDGVETAIQWLIEKLNAINTFKALK